MECMFLMGNAIYIHASRTKFLHLHLVACAANICIYTFSSKMSNVACIVVVVFRVVCRHDDHEDSKNQKKQQQQRHTHKSNARARESSWRTQFAFACGASSHIYIYICRPSSIFSLLQLRLC